MNKFYHNASSNASQVIEQGRSVLLRRRPQLRGESINAVFLFPKSVLDNCTSEDKSKTLRKHQSSGKISQKTIDLGRIGEPMEYNLRQTIVNQTRSVLSPSNQSKSAFHSTSSGKGEGKGEGARGFHNRDELWKMHNQANKNTLSSMQKAIIMEDKLFYFTQDVLQIQSSRPPILRRQERERKRRRPQPQQRLQSPNLPRSCRQKYQISNKMAAARQNSVPKQQRPEIRGWDTIQIYQI